MEWLVITSAANFICPLGKQAPPTSTAAASGLGPLQQGSASVAVLPLLPALSLKSHLSLEIPLPDHRGCHDSVLRAAARRCPPPEGTGLQFLAEPGVNPFSPRGHAAPLVSASWGSQGDFFFFLRNFHPQEAGCLEGLAFYIYLRPPVNLFKKKNSFWTSLLVQGFRLHASTAGSTGSTLVREVLRATQWNQKTNCLQTHLPVWVCWVLVVA